jgi:Peptidase family M41
MPGFSAATAFHEAGHAVAGWCLREPITRITIIPDGEFDGAVEFANVLRDADFETLDARNRARHQIVILWAGQIAQKHFDARSWHDCHGRFDRRDAVHLALKVTSGEDEAAALIAESEGVSRDLVLRSWPAVQAVAALLLERGEVEWAEVRDVLSTFVPPIGIELN